MRRSSRSAAPSQNNAPTVRQKRLTTGAILVVGALILVGVGATTLEGNRAEARVAETAADYKSPVIYTPPPKPTTVAFLGDSFTAGAGADMVFNRWSTLLANENGWLELNYGKGATNFGTGAKMTTAKAYRERLTEIVISQPDIVIVSSGGNNLDTDQVPGMRDTFRELKEELPDAQIVALSPLFRAAEMPPRLIEFGEDIEREVEAVGGTYVDIGHPLLGRSNVKGDDKGHPNDAGYRFIADAVGGALEDAEIIDGA